MLASLVEVAWAEYSCGLSSSHLLESHVPALGYLIVSNSEVSWFALSHDSGIVLKCHGFVLPGFDVNDGPVIEVTGFTGAVGGVGHVEEHVIGILGVLRVVVASVRMRVVELNIASVGPHILNLSRRVLSLSFDNVAKVIEFRVIHLVIIDCLHINVVVSSLSLGE
jgi:hypothetical protein